MPESDAPALSLVYQRGGEPAVFPIPEGTTTLGSAKDNDLVIHDPSVKPHQIVLMREGETVELRDLFAGLTQVNEVERMSGPLLPGDVLSLGEVRLRVMKVALTSSGRHPRLPDDVLVGSTPAVIDGPAEPAPAPPPAPRPDPSPVTPDTGWGPAAREEPAQDPVETPWPATVETFDMTTAQADRDELARSREHEARRAKSLARARRLSDVLISEADFHEILEHLVYGLLETFQADRAVTVLFEEDGRNPLLTVERCLDGSNQGEGIAEEIVERCLQVRTVLRIAGGGAGLGGLAAPLLYDARVLGLIYFERTTPGPAFGTDDVHLTAMLANQAAVVLGPEVAD